MPFSKGDPNINRKGRPKKGQSFGEALEKEAEEMVKDASGEELTKMQAIAKILWKKASKGDLKAIDMLLDRIDGKPKQALDVTSGGETITEVKQTIVGPGNTNT